MHDLVELHCHILPEMDDGAKDFAESLAMGRAYVEAGFSKVVVTPHWINGTRWAPSNEKVHTTLHALQQRLDADDVHLQLIPGMEVAMDPLFLKAPELLMDRLPINDGRYFLLEPPIGGNSITLEEMLRVIEECEKNIILAHAERCPKIQNTPEIINFFLGNGVLVQVNSGSLLGRNGKSAQETAFFLLEKGCVHFIASDAHGTSKRRPPSRLDLEELTAILGEDALLQGMGENPTRLLSGKAISPIKVSDLSNMRFDRTEKTAHSSTQAGLFSRFVGLFRK